MISLIRDELIRFIYYFEIQFNQIFIYWVIGILIGSIISVFAKDKINKFFMYIEKKNLGVIGIFIASLLGIISPLCMYGTIPIAAVFKKNGMKDDMLAAFMTSSILLNPQLLIYSSALGITLMLIRLNVSIIVGFIAGLLIRYIYKNKDFFDFTGFNKISNRDTDPNMFMRLLKNIGRNIKATGLYFLIGIVLSVLFQMYIPDELFASIFVNNKGFGLLMAATIGVPVYVCGGGTIPLLNEWIQRGMSYGSATSFMITGPATKITNLGALKIVLGKKNFAIYILYIIGISLISGFIVDMLFI